MKESKTQFSHPSRTHDVTRHPRSYFCFHARCYSLQGCTCRNTCHCARCQRRWVRPLAHGAAANQPGPRDWDPPTGRWNGAARRGWGYWLHRCPTPRRVPHVSPPLSRRGGRENSLESEWRKDASCMCKWYQNHEQHAIKCDQCSQKCLLTRVSP